MNVSQLFVDATGSIGLEEGHELADLMAFSSCKGLLANCASFIAQQKKSDPKDTEKFILMWPRTSKKW